MATQSVLDFVGMVGRAPDLQRKVDGLDGNLSGLVDLAATAGFRFTQEEWMDTVSGLLDKNELGLDALGKVVGGMTATTQSTVGDVSARFACFPPIGSVKDLTGGR